jgi:hypothetical protein
MVMADEHTNYKTLKVRHAAIVVAWLYLGRLMNLSNY